MSLVQVIDHLAEERRKELDPGLKPDEFFELFVSELVTRDYGLDWDDIESGIVDGENDGQIDAVYLFIDDILIKEEKEFDVKGVRRNAHIRVVIQQSKNSASFSENAFAKMRSSLCDLFNLAKTTVSLGKAYNSSVMAQVKLFRNVYLGMQGKNPIVHFDVLFASKGDKGTANDRIRTDSEAVKEFFQKEYFKSECEIRLLGARELVDLANKPQFINKKISFTVPPASDNSGEGWVGLVRVDEFFSLITNKERKLLTAIFEENVRDFEGDNTVNKEIAETLADPKAKVDFWWLNNGITLLCDEVQPHTQREFSLDRPLIVNGLQTANKIWQHFALKEKIEDGRHILVRIVKSKDELIRDSIIRATNRQTPIGPSQLRATEQLHRDIEGYFKSRGKYYERRKNQYKNAGRFRRDIFTINELAQAVIAVSLGRPNDARARPSSLLNSSDGYKEVFNQNAKLPFFSFCAELVRSVDEFLGKKLKTRKDRNNLKFYVSYIASRLLAGKINPSQNDLAKLLDAPIENKLLEAAYTEANKRYVAMGRDDDVARGGGLIAKIDKALPRMLKTKYSLRYKQKKT